MCSHNKDKKHLLFLTKYDQTGASSRHRTYQYLPFLKNISYSVSPLLNKEYLEKRFVNTNIHKNLVLITKAYIERIILIIFKTPKNYDLLVIEYELLPYFPAWLEKYLSWRKIPYIVDYDDALFHQYDHHKNYVISKLLSKKIATVMHLSSHVIAGNQYLANYAKQSQAKQVSIIPTVINLKHYSNNKQIKKNDIFTIVWIGSHTTTTYLKQILPALQRLNKQYRFRLRLIGASDISLPDIDVERLAWQQDKEEEYLRQAHVGIMPLPDTPWTRGKCGFKLIQYMVCDLPVIASPVGINTEIVQPNNGFLAKNTEEWIQAFEKLIKQPEKQIAMGKKGRQIVEQRYCIQISNKQFKNILKTLL